MAAGSTQFGTSMKDSKNMTKGQLREAQNTRDRNFLDQSVDYSQAIDVRNHLKSPYHDRENTRESRYRSTTINHNARDPISSDYSHRSQTIEAGGKAPKNIDDSGFNKRSLAQHAKLIKMRQRIPKIKVMRSSLFTKNPILEKNRDADLNSNYSAGRFSSFTRQPGGDVSKSAHFSIKDPAEDKPYSPKTLNVKSHSARKHKDDSKSKLEYRSHKLNKRNSIEINSSLTYVMVKGKVQPSEKYIYKGLTPYTNNQPY